MPPKHLGGEWLSANQAAEMVGLTKRTLYRLIDSGKLPGYKMGRVIRLRRHEVEEFIDRSRIQPGALRHLYPSEGDRAGGEDDVPQ